MKETDIEILRQIVSRTDKTGNEKVEMLIEFVSQQVKKLNEPAVSKCDGIERAHSVCDHPEKYRFVDRDGNLRCSSCHKVIEQTDC